VIAVSSATGAEYTAGLPTLDKGAEDGPRRNRDAPIILASAITASAGHHGHSSPRGDGSDNLVVADTLTSGSHPGSNMPGRRREDDTNIVAIAENQRGELLETPYSHKLTSGGGKPGQGYGAVRINAGVRRLTPTECERLQGLPDNWTRVPDTAPDSRRYAGLGDAVTSPVAEWIGRRILANVGCWPAHQQKENR
jgi:site-specific DNA-cytosine methylase